MISRRAALATVPAGLLVPAVASAASVEAAVREAYARWDAAFGKHDAKEIASFYTADALFVLATHKVLKGPSDVETFFAGLFAASVTAHKVELIQASGTDDLVTAAAKWSAQSKGGPVGGLAVHGFRRQENALKINLHTFN